MVREARGNEVFAKKGSLGFGGAAQEAVEEVLIPLGGRDDDTGILKLGRRYGLADQGLENRLCLEKFGFSEGIRLYFYELHQLVDPVVHRHPMNNRPVMAFC